MFSFRPLAAVVLAGVATVLFAAPAMAAPAAAPYPPVPSTASISASSTDPCPGDVVTLAGSHYRPGERITLTARAADGSAAIPLATVTADANGSFRVQVTTPLQSNGMFDITGAGTTDVASIDMDVCKVAAASAGSTSASSSGLASTGVQVTSFVTLAALAIGGGVLALRAGRRRRVSTTRR